MPYKLEDQRPDDFGKRILVRLWLLPSCGKGCLLELLHDEMSELINLIKFIGLNKKHPNIFVSYNYIYLL